VTHYRLDFKRHVAEEGENWQKKERSVCSRCGLRVVSFAKDFPVPDDAVERAEAAFFEPVDDPLVYVAGLLFAREEALVLFREAKVRGFSVRDAQVTLIGDSELPMPRYRWLVIEGRCVMSDVWDRVVDVCSLCGTPRTERLTSTQRLIRLIQEPTDGADICRGREAATGVVVSQRFRDVITEGLASVDDAIEFLPLERAGK